MARIFDVILAKSGNPEKTLLSHPEFISGSTKKMLKQVQHDKKKPGFPLLARMTYGTFLEPCNKTSQATA